MTKPSKTGGLFLVFGRDGHVVHECLTLGEAQSIVMHHSAGHGAELRIEFVPDASDPRLVAAERVQK